MPLTSDVSDARLVDLLKAGNEEAFTLIYDRYWRLMYGHVFKMLRDEDDTKDIIQELFSSLWVQASRIPDHQNLPGYLYVSARHKVLNLIRKHKYHSDYLGSLASFATDMSNVTLEVLEERELADAIEREIQNLPPRMRQVFEMSRKENLSHKEIAARLGTSDETVKKQINKSLKVIRSGLKASGNASILILVFLR